MNKLDQVIWDSLRCEKPIMVCSPYISYYGDFSPLPEYLNVYLSLKQAEPLRQALDRLCSIFIAILQAHWQYQTTYPIPKRYDERGKTSLRSHRFLSRQTFEAWLGKTVGSRVRITPSIVYNLFVQPTQMCLGHDTLLGTWVAETYHSFRVVMKFPSYDPKQILSYCSQIEHFLPSDRFLCICITTPKKSTETQALGHGRLPLCGQFYLGKVLIEVKTSQNHRLRIRRLPATVLQWY